MFDLFNRRKVAELQYHIDRLKENNRDQVFTINQLRSDNDQLKAQVQSMHTSLQRAAERNNELRDELNKYDDEAEKSRRIVQRTEYMKEREKQAQENSDHMRNIVTRNRQYEKESVQRGITTTPGSTVTYNDPTTDILTAAVVYSALSDSSDSGSSFSSSCDSGSSSSFDSGSSGGCD